MKQPVRTKEQRLDDQAERGRAALQIVDNEHVMAWFSTREAEHVEAMIAAVSDDERSRAAAAIREVRALKSALENDAAFGRKAMSEIDKRRHL